MSWRSIDPLPAARWNLAVASHRNWIYVAGGATDFAMTTAPLSILKSRIEPDGSGGANSPWVSCAPDMTTGKIGATLLAVSGNLVLVGGRGVDPIAADVLPAQDIHVGKIDSDGNVPQWTHLVGVLPAPILSPGVVVKDDYLYILGGTDLKVILAFGTQTGNFTAGQVVTGLTSGASAVLASDSDAGATGTLTFTNPITGVFASGETIVDPLGGSATTSATIVKKISYKNQTINFTASQVVRGITSGSNATRVSDADAGATGTLTVNAVTGLFQDSEPLTVAHATANGAMVPAPADSFYLDYDTQTVNFTVGGGVKGAAGATGVISADVDAGATGTLTLTGVVGNFVAGEALKGSNATANGAMAPVPADSFYLDYDTQTGNFTVGQVVTGAGGATGTISADVDGGATGTLTLTGVVGNFVAGENITDPVTGVAKVAAGTVKYKTLDYDAQTINFIAADAIVGFTSDATATVMSDVDGGATGTLKLKLITGTFVNDEFIGVTNAALVAAGTVKYKTLDYDAQTTDFALSQVIWGVTSGATATILADTDAGVTGTLKLKLITGTFANDELLGVQYAETDGVLVQTITYASQSGNFTVGDTVTGATSGATGVIYQNNDVGATGSLILTGVVGIFQNGEVITGALGGGALADGASDFYNLSQDSVYRARLGPDGSVGEFALLDGVLPVSGDLAGVCEVVGNHLFISDGTDLHVAHIGPAGLGPWSTQVPGFTRTLHRLIKMPGEKLLALGGYTGATTASTCFSATVNSGGEANPVTWPQTQPMPLAKRTFGATRIGNRLFAIGGVDAANAVRTEVYSTRIEPSGRIGGV